MRALDLILKCRESRDTPDLYESMSLPDYFNLVMDNPAVARRAYARLYDMIMSYGTETFVEFGKEHTRYLFFSDPFDGTDSLYGNEIALERMMLKLASAAKGHAAARRILLLHGPVGSAKSTIVRLIKKGYEAYSKLDEGRLYTFTWVRLPGEGDDFYDDLYGKGVLEVPSAMHQDPLYIIDPEDRHIFISAVAEKHGPGTLTLRGDLDPMSQFFYSKLLSHYGGNWQQVINHIRVERLIISEKGRKGIGTFQPKDEKNQDSTELTGNINYRKIAIYGSDSDPRAFNFDGEFNVANRGIIEFVELLKLDTAFLYDLLTASEEGKIKPKKFAQCDIDEVIIGHNNEPELRRLEQDEFMQALRSRTIALQFPYVSKASEEAKIYERDHGNHPGLHIAPHTFTMAAFLAVASRLDDPKGFSCSLIQKVKLYDGQHVPGFTDENVKELRKESPREGMDRGLSPRALQDAFDNVVTANSDRGCIHSFLLFQEMRRSIKRLPLSGDERERLITLLAEVEEEYEDRAKIDVQKAIAADHSMAQQLFERYMDNIEAYLAKRKIKNQVTGRDEEPDEQLMSAIEEMASVKTGNKKDFRQQLLAWMGAQLRQGSIIDYTSNTILRRAIEKYLFSKQKDSIHLSSLVTGTVSDETQAKIDIVKQRLIDEQEYCEVCASDVLSYVSSVFARGENK